ncbi:MAG: hypothetical protein DHS20C06_16560 [Hyphobacterium sp.]|nr:MAG: hypothetical protein DHS20C06_16560 [Hyphobacterium sp.]
MAREAIWQRPVRAVMMICSLGAGVAVVTLTTGIIAGFGSEIERLSFGAYARSLLITPNYLAADQARFSRLTDLDRLIEGIGGDEIEGAAAWRRAYQVPVSARDYRADLTVFGVRGDYQFEADMDMAQGRPFSPSDLESSRRVCLLGADAALALFPQGRASGQTIRVDGVGCHVQGVFERGDTLVSSRFSNAILAPFDTAARYFMPMDTLAPNEANRLTIVLRDRDSLHWARVRADRILRRQHGVPLSQAAPFIFVDPAAPAAAMEQQRNLLSNLLVAIAITAMLAAIIGYGGANWTLAELRRRNIGLQMTLGASSTDIFLQFTLESLFLGTGGGLIGVGVALTLGRFAEAWMGWPAEFDLFVMIGAVLLGAITGAIAGTAAAGRAAATLPAYSTRG